jgi:hypothetical protein
MCKIIPNKTSTGHLMVGGSFMDKMIMYDISRNRTKDMNQAVYVK